MSPCARQNLNLKLLLSPMMKMWKNYKSNEEKKIKKKNISCSLIKEKGGGDIPV